jgi:hypothetical protein
MGGVMGADDVEALRAIGASAVQSATAAFFNPSLAFEVAERYRSHIVSEREAEVLQQVLATVDTGPKSIPELLHQLGGALDLSTFERAGRVRQVLNSLETRGLVRARYSDGKLLFERSDGEPPRLTAAG